jgi:hypothetical protein
MLIRFPELPRDPFWSSDTRAAREALGAIAAWREAWCSWLGGDERDDGISPAMATTLLELLGALPGESWRRFKYALGPFPDLGGEPLAALHRVLLWRAGVADFLADVWDTIGEAAFGFDECQRIASLLIPSGLSPGEERTTCLLCLGPKDRGHFDRCAVQLEWRSRS